MACNADEPRFEGGGILQGRKFFRCGKAGFLDQILRIVLVPYFELHVAFQGQVIFLQQLFKFSHIITSLFQCSRNRFHLYSRTKLPKGSKDKKEYHIFLDLSKETD